MPQRVPQGRLQASGKRGLKEHATANTDLLTTDKSQPHRVLVLPSGCDNNVKEDARKLDAKGGGWKSGCLVRSLYKDSQRGLLGLR
jgi:hypothetical protein